MANQQLIDYIKASREAGQTDDQIQLQLVNAGWPINDVNGAMNPAPPPPSPAPPPPLPQSQPTPPSQQTPPPVQPGVQPMQPHQSQSSQIGTSQGQAPAPSKFFDEKTIKTTQWSAIWNVVAAFIVSVVDAIAIYFFAGSNLFGDLGPFGEMLGREIFGSMGGRYFWRSVFSFDRLSNSVIYGAIWGVVIAIIIAKLYPEIMAFQKRALSNKFNTLFKLLFWPTVILFVISLLLNESFMLTRVLVYSAGVIAARYLYAKMMVKYVGKYYPEV